MMTAAKHDDRKGHHYYTTASQADAFVYSSDDPCGHHGRGAVIMGEGPSSWARNRHHGRGAVIMGEGPSSWARDGHHGGGTVIMGEGTMEHYSKVSMPHNKGQLHLHFTHDQERHSTQLTVCEQHPPLQVIRAFPLSTGGVLVHVHNVSGGVLGGDQLVLDVEVGPGAQVQLTSTSATRLYRSRPEASPATQTGTIKICEGALLEYLPDPLIPFSGSRYQQRTRIDLEADAGLFWWETITPGRVARGELFDYAHLLLSLNISAQGRPIAIESLKLEPHCRELSSLARLGPYYYFCSFYICRVGLEAGRWSTLEKELGALAQELSRPGELHWGVSTLVAHGLVVRALSRQGRDIAPGLLAFWRAAKQRIYGEEPVPPRKIY